MPRMVPPEFTTIHNLLHVDSAEGPGQIAVRAGGKEQLVGVAVLRRTPAERNPPNLADLDGLAGYVFDRAHPLSGHAVNALMVPVLVLFETSKVLLSEPKFLGATARPQGWLRGKPCATRFRKTPPSL